MEEIKASDIMIGNIVTVDNPKHHPKLKGVPLRVTAIQEVDFGKSVECHLNLEHINQDPNTYYDTYSQFFRFIRPIPLTEDILLKAGFERNQFDVLPTFKLGVLEISLVTFYDEDANGIGFNFSEWKLSGVYGDDLTYFKSSPSIKYLHQLHNLYKSLTGNELEISL